MSQTVSMLANATASLAGEATCGEKAEESTVSEGLVVMGTLMVIAASFVSTFGINLQKLAHNKNESKTVERRRPMTKNWRWWSGILTMVLGSVMDMAALAFVPLTRVAALGATTLVANIIITPWFLKETRTWHDIIGCAILVAGTTVTCIFGASSEIKLTSTCLLDYFTEDLFIVYAVCNFAFLVFLFYFIHGFNVMNAKAKAAGLIGGDNQPPVLETVWIHDNLHRLERIPRDKNFKFVTRLGPQFYPSVHAVYGGIWGALSTLFAKACLIFFTNVVKNDDTLNSVFYLLLFLVPTGLCLYNQIRYFNIALKIYADAIFVIPVYEAFWICMGIAGGLVFYQEYKQISGLNTLLFWLGVLIALVGLATLAARSSSATGTRVQESEASRSRVSVKEVDELNGGLDLSQSHAVLHTTDGANTTVKTLNVEDKHEPYGAEQE